MPEQRMSAHLTRLAKKRGRLPALVTALLVLAALTLQQVLSSLLGPLISNMAIGTRLLVEDVALSAWEPQWLLEPLLLTGVPFALGVFLSLWMIAPIAEQLTLRFVLTRAFLAVVAGALVVFVVSLFAHLIEAVSPSIDFGELGLNALYDLQTALTIVIFRTPLVLLAGVLLWLWLRDHPRDYEVTGLVDEL